MAQLIDRFMSGDTTVAEERMLGEYFRTARRIPREWQTYKEMFSYFDRGMRRQRPLVVRLWPCWVAAAVVLLVFSLSVMRHFRQDNGDAAALARQESVHRDRTSAPAERKTCENTVRESSVAVSKNVAGASRPRPARRPSRPPVTASPRSAGHVPANQMPVDGHRQLREAFNELVAERFAAMSGGDDRYILVADEYGYYHIVETEQIIML